MMNKRPWDDRITKATGILPVGQECRPYITGRQILGMRWTRLPSEQMMS